LDAGRSSAWLPLYSPASKNLHKLRHSGLSEASPFPPQFRTFCLKYPEGPRSSEAGSGRAIALCPGKSDINLFGDRQGIIYFDTEISNGALDFGVTEKELHGS
jgi:hypothetical protein